MLFVSREGIRLSILWESSSGLDLRGVQRLVNLSWLPFFVLLLLLLSVLYYQRLHLHWQTQLILSSTSHEDFSMIVLHNLGALVECISEPWYNMAGVDGLVHVRLHAEALGLIARAVVTFICITHYDQGILAFGIAQLVYVVVYTIALIALSYISRKSRGNEDRNDVIKNSGIKFIPISVFVKRSNNFLPRLLYYPSSWSVSYLLSFMLDNLGGRSLLLAAAMTGTVIMKHISTEADKIILSIYVSYYNQGIYSVANNYCSLVARLVFFPIEEACRLTFLVWQEISPDWCVELMHKRKVYSNSLVHANVVTLM